MAWYTAVAYFAEGLGGSPLRGDQYIMPWLIPEVVAVLWIARAVLVIPSAFHLYIDRIG